MKRMTYLVMALALVLGFTQCKKEQTNTTAETQGVQITLKVDGGASTGSAAGGSRAIVDPAGNANYATVSFETGDVIYVGYNNAYVGSLTYSDGNFSGSINISESDAQNPLDLYFLGGMGFETTVDENENTATVVISDQTTKYPVISYARSKYRNGEHHAKLMNKCSIIKVNATLPDAVAAAPICITGMNNKVTVNFNDPNGDDNGFEYGIDGEGVIKMPAKDADNVSWAIVLPQAALEEGEDGSAYTELPETLLNYYSSRPQVHEIESNKYYSGSDDAIILAITTGRRVVNFTYWTSGLDFQEQDYDIYTGELSMGHQPPLLGNNDGKWRPYTLKDVTIHENLDCSGNVVLTLKGNNVIGCEDRFFNYAGLAVNGASYNGNQYYTLVIDGDGSLVVSGGYDWPGIGSCVQSCGNIEIRGGHITAIGDGTAPGIGAGKNYTCRNITITGGTVIAKGGNLTGSSNGGAGIGTSGPNSNGPTCGNILITGGTVEATGGYYAAGIGTAFLGRCGTITITDGVTQVKATKGTKASKSIGLGRKYASTSCGTVTIGGVTGQITESPYTYPEP